MRGWKLAFLLLASVLPGATAQEPCLVSVVASEKSTEALAQQLARQAPPMVARVAQRLKLPAPPRIHVIVAARVPRNREEAARLGLSRVPVWAAGVAQEDRSRIVIFADSVGGYSHPSLPGVFAHETAHLILAAGLPRGAWVPRWYDEGIAQIVERDLSIYEALQLARMTIASRPPPIARLALSWPQAQSDARNAYAISLSFVAYAEAHAPSGAPRRLAAAMQQGALFDEAFTKAYGVRPKRMERFWRESLEDLYLHRPIWILLGASNALMGVLAILAVVRIRRRNRLRLEEWELEERELR